MRMREEMIQELTMRIIPFWKRLRDDVYGGYYGFMDYDLQIGREAEKGCILNSRILWFFSSAYLTLHDRSLLREAMHAYRFLKEKCVDHQYGGIYWSMTYDGKVCDATKHTYNQAFAIYALCAYYEAAGDPQALSLARQIFEIMEKNCRDETGYLEAFGRDFTPESNEKLSENSVIAERTMNTALHVLEAYTQLYRVTKDAVVKEKLMQLLKVIHTKIYNPQKRRQEVFFDKEYHSILDLHSYGHDIEASWLIDLALDALGEQVFEPEVWEEMRRMTGILAKETYERAFDGTSFANECEAGVVDETRIWWVQAEAVVGFMNVFQKTADSGYRNAVDALWDFIKSRIIDPRNGSEWYWEVDIDGTPACKPIVEPWKCPYHNGRMCMEMINRLFGNGKKEKNNDT